MAKKHLACGEMSQRNFSRVKGVLWLAVEKNYLLALYLTPVRFIFDTGSTISRQL